MQNKIPVTILTGFLGSGKTTLLNRILGEQHGLRIAVIENEYGEIGIDQGLVIDAEEEIFEMSNGCICCTVRGDLIRVLTNLSRRRDKFDIVLVETTGLADPGPVAQTFFMDDDIRDEYRLDAIITLVDAKHIGQQLGRSREATEQVAFADVIVLNKTDLVTPTELDAVEATLRGINRLAKVVRTQQGKVPLETVLAQFAFDLDKALAKRPTFLEPEYPFEWSGVYPLAAGRYELTLSEGPDPSMTLLAMGLPQGTNEALHEAAEQCVRWFAADKTLVAPESVLSLGPTVWKLDLGAAGDKSFYLNVPDAQTVALFTQHLPEEFGLRLLHHEGPEVLQPTAAEERGLRWTPVPRGFKPPHYETRLLQPQVSRTWVAEHEHDNEVSSVAIEQVGSVDHARFTEWLRKVLREQGADIFRMKGFISIDGHPLRFVFQGVHMLFDGQPQRPWGDVPRLNQLVFIGRNLDGENLREGFQSCLI